MTDKTTFKVGDRVQTAIRTFGLIDRWADGFTIVSVEHDGLWVLRDDGAKIFYNQLQNVRFPPTPYPEYAFDVTTYRDAVNAGREQGQTGQMTALLRLIGHLLGERGGR